MKKHSKNIDIDKENMEVIAYFSINEKGLHFDYNDDKVTIEQMMLIMHQIQMGYLNSILEQQKHKEEKPNEEAKRRIRTYSREPKKSNDTKQKNGERFHKKVGRPLRINFKRI